VIDADAADRRGSRLTAAVHCCDSVLYAMVLSDLGRKLNAALSSLNRVSVVDEKVAWLHSPCAYIHMY